MSKAVFVAAIALVAIGAGWAQSDVATADYPVSHSALVNVQALQEAAKDLPEAVIDYAI
jgi:hypothetical protein